MTERPHLTSTEPCHGVLKAHPEDFEVEEIAKIEPSGSGTHCWLWIQKRDLTTPEAAKRIARALEVDARGIGWAGMKDRHAVTRQWLSVPDIDVARASALEVDGLEVLDARLHDRKLKSGVLRGNRFVLVLREVDAARGDDLRETLAVLERRGAPNYFGVQRFGRDGRNVEHARAWLVEGGRRPRDRFRRKMLVSAFQSAAFNELLARRVLDGTMDRAVAGDVMKKVETGGTFLTDDVAAEQPRIEAWEISPTGPMFGSKMQRATEAAGSLEEEIEEKHGFGPEVYRAMGKLGQGTRRPLRIRVETPDLVACPDGFRLSMTLPSGAYATEVLRELFKGGLVDASRPQNVCNAEASQRNNG